MNQSVALRNVFEPSYRRSLVPKAIEVDVCAQASMRLDEKSGPFLHLATKPYSETPDVVRTYVVG